ncbi:hypothetical protein [Roseivivax lentus]|uniref:hypothetical protein n=1 Tax=Roseivivax lentus TaxID=633194 RepID=UPI0013564DEA|nr:hypothetical protein [Roseivivax lentus]
MKRLSFAAYLSLQPPFGNIANPFAPEAIRARPAGTGAPRPLRLPLSKYRRG